MKELLEGRSSLVGAMGWMLGLSFLGGLLLGWVPVIGPFVGPVCGGFVGGRRAGSVGSALVAAVLPALLLALLIFGIGGIAAGFVRFPLIGAVAAMVAGLTGIVVIIHSGALIVLAAIGAATREA